MVYLVQGCNNTVSVIDCYKIIKLKFFFVAFEILLYSKQYLVYLINDQNRAALVRFGAWLFCFFWASIWVIMVFSCFCLFSLIGHPGFFFLYSYALCLTCFLFFFSVLWLIPFPHLCSAEPPVSSESSKATVCLVHPGDIVKLNCPLPEAAAIVWTKDGTSLLPDNRTLIEHEQLHIRHAAPTDSGLYTCQATGTKATDAVCFIVNVTGEMP